jgi:ankyrin repeat protein
MRKTIKLALFILLVATVTRVSAQEIPADVVAAIKTDDAAKLGVFITKDNINDCYGNYSLLSQTVRFGAMKCFTLLIEKGADVNKSCNGYVPPLMHAAKYGRLEMVKVLVAKGADVNYTYDGDYTPAKGQTPITYAETNRHPDVVEYLKSVKK